MIGGLSVSIVLDSASTRHHGDMCI